jgi:protein required for attachment to host cells
VPQRKDCWLIAADERTVFILKNEGDEYYPRFKLLKSYRWNTFSVPRENANSSASEHFITRVAECLEDDCALDSFGALAIAARPEIIAALRKAMSPRVNKFIASEIPKT